MACGLVAKEDEVAAFSEEIGNGNEEVVVVAAASEVGSDGAYGYAGDVAVVVK